MEVDEIRTKGKARARPQASVVGPQLTGRLDRTAGGVAMEVDESMGATRLAMHAEARGISRSIAFSTERSWTSARVPRVAKEKEVEEGQRD